MSNTLFGVKSETGELVKLGEIQADAEYQKLVIVRSYFGSISKDAEDGTDADMCYYALNDYLAWLIKEGFITCGTLIMKKI